MDGMNANFPGGNATNMLQQMNYNSMQNIPQNQSIPGGPNINNLNNHVNSINNTSNNPADICNPKRQAVFDRLKKRMNTYRGRQRETVPRFDQTFNGICEQQSVETNVLQKRFIETKAKRVAKKADKKQTETAPSGNLSQSKQMKRSALDDLENDDVHPTAAKQMATGGDNMKFQVEIVQQLEFTTSAANMPQQISTNVTVKATTNGSLKYEPQEMKGMKMEPGKMQMAPLPPAPPDILQDFKQEPDNEFADLDFGGIANFMANDENELKKLFSNISDVFDQDLFDQDKIKQEPRPTPPQQIIPQMPQQNMNQMNQIPQSFNDYVMPDNMQMQKPMMHQQPPQMQQHQQQQQQFNRMYPQNVPQQVQQPQQQMPEMSPAAQTLKNMAQQHQVKSSMAMNYMRPPTMGQQMMPQMNQQPNPMQQRMPYQQQQQQQPQQVPPQQPQQQFNNDYSNQFNKNQMQMPFSPDMIKQEMMMQQQPQMQPMHQQHQMKPVMNHPMMMGQNEEMKMNQQYQQYQNTQFVTNLPPQQQQRNQFNPNQNSMNIHMKQTQMMHIQQNNNGNIQMQGAQHQHMHFAGDMKMGENSNFSMQQQQNMYFNHHSQYNMQQAMQKRPPQQPHHGDGPNNNFNMMQSQQMSFTQ